jgi:hypothetical protein
MKRLIAAFAAALMLAVGVPGVASAARSATFSINGNNPPSTTVVVDNWIAGINTFAGKDLGGIQSGDTLKFKVSNISLSSGSCFGSIIIYSQTPELVTAKYVDGTSAQVSSAGQVVAVIVNPTSSTIEITIPLTSALDPAPNWSRDWGNIGILRDGFGASCDAEADAWIYYGFNSTGVWSAGEEELDPLTTSTPTLKRNGISFTPDNFDPTCAYEISTTAGTAIQNPVTGEVNVYGVGSGSSVTVTITDCTGATATVSGKATAATAPVITLSKPTVSTTADAITCSAGTSTVNPTSVAFTLLVDGVAVSTRFSDGAIAPSLVATTAAQNLYTGATLSKASWTVDPAWAGKSYSCTTTSYAAGAVGIANS